ncbi:pyridoxamine 5'-phosphate oxidase family protein [Knoellia sp. CPCC 206435]|uniref:pyridoxamine 5'-phosphate oxidase family protein n=1 Tax=Knoellia terrae TaxID=3404797 RepID=UPI003B43AA27
MSASDAADVPVDHSGLRVMSTEECMERLSRAGLGRLGFVLAGEVTVLPVHHLVHGMELYFRTSGGSKIEAAADHSAVGFEIDDYDRATVTGWSVSVSGTASLVDDEQLAEELAGLDDAPWPGGDPSDSVWVRIRPDQISGRELLPH